MALLTTSTDLNWQNGAEKQEHISRLHKSAFTFALLLTELTSIFFGDYDGVVLGALLGVSGTGDLRQVLETCRAAAIG